MEKIKIKDAPGKGKGVFATSKIGPKDHVYGTDDFALSAISTSQLSYFCFHCHGGSRYDEQGWYSIGQKRDADLKVCAGCKVAYFCGKKCQTMAWKNYHKFECKIYARLQPKILPESIRAVVRFALQKHNSVLLEGVWQTILQMESHVKELQETGGDTWTNLMLMSTAAAEYSKILDQATFLHLLCVLKTNAMTLQTTANDPIGLFLDPFLSSLNHSCDANTAVHRPMYTNSVGWSQRKQPTQVMLALLPLRPIEEDEELTIPYVDCQDHVDKRQAALKRDYFFECTCSKCIQERKFENIILESDTEFLKVWSTWQSSADEQIQRLSTPPFTTNTLAEATEVLREISMAMEANPKFSPTMNPYSRVIHELKLLHMSEQMHCDQALIQAFTEYLVIGPKLYVSGLNPAHVVNAIYLLQLLGLFDETYQASHANGSHVERQRKEVERLGLSKDSLEFWRAKIAVEMRLLLQDTVAADLASCFEIELLSAGIEHVQKLRHLYDDPKVRLRAEKEVQKLLDVSDDRWEEARKSWTSPQL